MHETEDNIPAITACVIPCIPYMFGYGGLEIQTDKTNERLPNHGVHIELLDVWKRASLADLFHIYGSAFHHAEIVERIHTLGIPLVITSMFMLTHPTITYKALSLISHFSPGSTVNLRKRNLKDANAVIAISPSEQKDLVDLFQVDPKKTHVIANGTEDHFFQASPTLYRDTISDKPFVLCVGVIEPRKNQIRLIEAMKDLSMELVFIGPLTFPAKHQPYVREFKRLVEEVPYVRWLGELQHDHPLLASAYAAAAAHVLPSTVEAQGMATLEAAAAGTRVVVSNLPTLRSLFGSEVTYCNPNSTASIRRAISKALDSPPPLQEHPWWLQSWDSVAAQVAEVYRSVL